MADPIKIYPTVEQCQINNKVTCPIENCDQDFSSESNLNMHIAKTHNKSFLKASCVERHYFCPETKCPWNNKKHFKNIKDLRQHYLKVHTEKQYSCALCKKSFPNYVFLTRHSEYCDITFTCLDCKAFYDCYETLRTHCRRKKHRILNKCEYKTRGSPLQAKSDIYLSGYKKLIAPKKSLSEEIIFRGTKSPNTNQKCQTNDEEKPLLKSKMTQVNTDSEFAVPQTTQHTQTGSRNVVLSVETQTIGDFFNIKPKMEVYEDNFKHTNTQTDAVESRESSSNTSFNLDDFEVTFNSYIEKNSSSTQTSWPDRDIFGISTATHGSIHTDTSDLLTDTLNFDTNFFNCNTETQTDFMFENDIFNSDYYSNMYTQTCDDILSGLNGFNDNQTQTVLHETLRSVESQTLMSSADKLCPYVLKDIVHSETQTDAEFRQMLEIINS